MKKHFQFTLVMILFVLFIANSSFVSLDQQNQTLKEFQTGEFTTNMSALSVGDNNCIGCHLHLEYSQSPTLDLVHQPTNPNHRRAISDFVNTHNNLQASEKTVDLDKVVSYLETLSY